MRHRNYPFPFLFFMLALGAMSVFPEVCAEVYKWVDDNGVVQFGDKPAHSRAQTVKLPATGKTDPAAGKRQQRIDKMLRIYQEERQEKRAQKAQEAETKAENKKKCNQARDRLASYEGARLYDLDENGERVYLSDGAHAEAMAEIRAEVEKWCN